MLSANKAKGIDMDSVTDICKYHFLCFVTMFLGQISQRRRKMTLKHFLKRQNRSKNKIRKITVKSRNAVKSACFDMFCAISQPFLKIST